MDSVAILGSSKSLKRASHLSANTYKIAIGDVPFRARKLGPFDLWVTANTEFPNMSDSRHRNMITKSNCKNLALSTICFNDGPEMRPFLQESLLLDAASPSVFFFDQRHTQSVLCAPTLNCCRIYEHLDEPMTLQEFLKIKYGLEKLPYGSGHTVAIHALAIAIMLKPKSIKIFGVDLPFYDSDYTYYNPLSKIDKSFIENLLYHFRLKIGKKKPIQVESPFAGEIREELLDDFQSLINLAFFQGTIIQVMGDQSSLMNLENVVTDLA